NGGFALITLGKVGLEQRIGRWDLEAARRSIAIGVEAIETVRELIVKEQIGCDAQEDGSLLVAHGPHALAELKDRLRLYREALKYPEVEFLDRARLEDEGFLRGPSAHGALRTRNAFGLHPMKYVRGLAAAALRKGAEVYEGSPVVAWRREGAD